MALYNNVFPQKKCTLLYLIAMIHLIVAMLVSTRPSLRFSKPDFVGQPFSKMSMDKFEHVIDAKEHEVDKVE